MVTTHEIKVWVQEQIDDIKRKRDSGISKTNAENIEEFSMLSAFYSVLALIKRSPHE